MMRRLLKWTGVLLGVVLVLVIIALVYTYLVFEERQNRTYNIQPQPVSIPAEIISTERDWPLLWVNFCEDCHGSGLAGKVIYEDFMYGRIAGPNLTSGRGGAGRKYGDVDWVRALRHGVDPDAKPLLLMPSHLLNKLSDADLGTIIGYVKRLPPVENELPGIAIAPIGRLIIALRIIPETETIIPAEVIDHKASRPPDPRPGVTAEYGKYLAVLCTNCHTQNLAGGPGAGQGMNLTPGGKVGTWSEADLIRTLRTGTAPDGKELKNEEMPWRTIGKMSDDQLKAIWLYLRSLPPIQTEHQ